MDKDIDYSVWSKIIEFEEAIHLNDEKKGEVAAAFTSDGRLMCFFARFSALMVDEAECPPARGSILTHNHVSDTAFSMHDIKTAAELGLIELRVVGPSGWHSLKPGHGGWPSPFEISKTYNRISSEVAGLPEDCDMKDVSVRICERLVDELGMIYERGNFSHS